MNKLQEKIIASLTSYGERIYTVHLAIETILKQTLKADKTILWLDKDEFNFNTIPKTLKALQEEGLTISFCENFKSYKKLIPTVIEHPNDIIITFDDDILYEVDLIENLYSEYQKNPKKIYCGRANTISINNFCEILPYEKWQPQDPIENTGLLTFPTGAGGVLYPPKVLHSDVTNHELFLKLAPTADDIWFKAMSLLNNIECQIIKHKDNKFSHVTVIEGTDKNSLWKYNILGENDLQIQQVFQHYDLYKKICTAYLDKTQLKYQKEYDYFSNTIKQTNTKVILVGFNDLARLIYEKHKNKISFIIDNFKAGQYINDKKLSSIHEIPKDDDSLIIICNQNFKHIYEITHGIKALNLTNEVITKISRKLHNFKKLKVYAGDIHKRDNYYDKYIGLSLTRDNENHINWDLTYLPLPFENNSVEVFQAEDVLEHIDYDFLPSLINEIYRILQPNGYFRLSIPDYNCDILYERSIYNYNGDIVYDPGGGGKFEKPGHVWFPTYENTKVLLEKTLFSLNGRIEFLHYWVNKQEFIAKEINYSKGFIQRTPDNDERVKTPYRPMSIVIDLYKDKE